MELIVRRQSWPGSAAATENHLVPEAVQAGRTSVGDRLLLRSKETYSTVGALSLKHMTRLMKCEYFPMKIREFLKKSEKVKLNWDIYCWCTNGRRWIFLLISMGIDSQAVFYRRLFLLGFRGIDNIITCKLCKMRNSVKSGRNIIDKLTKQ